MPYFLTQLTTFTQTFFVRNEQEVGSGTGGLSDLTVEKAQPAFDLFSVGGEARVMTGARPMSRARRDALIRKANRLIFRR